MEFILGYQGRTAKFEKNTKSPSLITQARSALLGQDDTDASKMTEIKSGQGVKAGSNQALHKAFDDFRLLKKETQTVLLVRDLSHIKAGESPADAFKLDKAMFTESGHEHNRAILYVTNDGGNNFVSENTDNKITQAKFLDPRTVNQAIVLDKSQEGFEDDFASALRHMDLALRLKTVTEQSFEAAQLLIKAGDLKTANLFDALDILEALINKDPENIEFLTSQAQACELLGDDFKFKYDSSRDESQLENVNQCFTEAIYSYQKIREIQRGTSVFEVDTATPVAKLHYKSGNYDKAIDACKAILEQDDDFPTAYIILIRSLFDSGDNAGAKAAINDALRINRVGQEVYDCLAITDKQLNDYDYTSLESMHDIRTVLALDLDNLASLVPGYGSSMSRATGSNEELGYDPDKRRERIMRGNLYDETVFRSDAPEGPVSVVK